MRIKLKKGYQKRLILKAKKNLTWKRLGELSQINKDYLRRDLLNERVLLSEKDYRELSKIAKIDYDEFILKTMNDNWGQVKGGEKSLKEEKLLITKKSKELAEFIGIMLGDGNIWTKKYYYYITVVGDSEKDKGYLLDYVNPLFKKLFKKEMYSYKHKSKKELFISIGSKDVVFTLKKFGLPSGNKLKNNVGIPKWIFESDEYLKSCIRGLIDTDGCVCPITGRDYPYIWFYSSIDNLRKTFSEAMKKLGIKTSKWNIRENRSSYIYIANKEMIKKYIQTISFKNPRHLNRLMPLSYSGQILSKT